MTVYERKGTPYYVIEFVYKGERHKYSSGTTSKREAQAMEAEHKKRLREEVVHGKLPDMTLQEAMKRYVATVVKLNKSDGVREQSAFKRLGAFWDPNGPLTQVTTASVSEFQQELLEEELAPASINRYTDLLKAILNKAHDEWGVLKAVPSINSLKVQNARLRFLSEEEEARLMAEASPHTQRLITFLIGTGARRGEALKLTWQDVDLTSNARAAVRFVDTKTGQPRRVPLPNSVRDLLVTMKAEVGKPAPKDRVFTWVPPGENAQRVPYDNPRKAFVNAVTKAKLEDVTLHTLRHTYASRLVMKGVPIFQVSKLLGHSKIQMTMRYAHLAPEGLDDAVAALDAPPPVPGAKRPEDSLHP